MFWEDSISFHSLKMSQDDQIKKEMRKENEKRFWLRARGFSQELHYFSIMDEDLQQLQNEEKSPEVLVQHEDLAAYRANQLLEEEETVLDIILFLGGCSSGGKGRV